MSPEKPVKKSTAKADKERAPLTTKIKPAKPRLGWREWVSVPELGVAAVKAKVDTGARSSSLHAEDVMVLDKRGKHYVQFVIGGGKRKGKLYRGGEAVCEVPLHDMRWVTSSNGTRQRRPVIRIEVHLCGQSWPVDLTLTSRENMGFPMLLGREAIRGRFVVDPARSYLSKEHLPLRRKALKQATKS